MIYPTITAAVDALCLDVGFNPFLVDTGKVIDPTGRAWTKPTREALCALGYPVLEIDPARHYVTLMPDDGYYTAVLMDNGGDWDATKRRTRPEGDVGYGEDSWMESREVQSGPSSNAELIARSKAIDWARELGVRYLG